MSMVINNNLMAANTARNLNAHYGRLATSTQRLSTGLRVNSAADDAAGLAIRELQRADIAALQQGVRNANDAISLIQTADGALGIIDEKLIRMKELAEQAATGTYDSTQRLMIDSEYQQMASEITRIANATDFNGIHLLNGSLQGEHDGSGLEAAGKMKIHFGTGNDSAEDYYYIEIGDCTAQALGLGNGATWQDAQNRAVATLATTVREELMASGINEKDQAIILSSMDKFTDYINNALALATDYTKAYQFWATSGTAPYAQNPDPAGFLEEGKKWDSDSDLMDRYLAAGKADTDQGGTDNLDKFWNSISTSEKQKLQFAWGQAALYNLGNYPEEKATQQDTFGLGLDSFQTKFKKELDALTGGQASKDAFHTLFHASLEKMAAQSAGMEYGGQSIQTQEDAQKALVAVNNAIVSKDKIRAHLGALQNRLENTVSNLNIQAENLQAAESRISDVDVATEMTQFVRNQILTQSAVAMLSQANSLPQMAMQLIG